MTTNPTRNVPSLWPTLLDQVEAHNGVMKVTIEFLRQIAGAQRMGPKVADKIKAGLEVQGLRSLPDDLNLPQHEEVVLIQAGTPAYELIQALAHSDYSDTLIMWLERLNTLPRDPETLVDRKELRELAESIVGPVSQLLSMTRPQDVQGDVNEDEILEPDRVAHRLAQIIPMTQTGQ